MELTKALQDYPDISFIEGYTLKKLQDEMLFWMQEKYREITGKALVLHAADERRLLLQTCAYYIFHGYELIDKAGKSNLLKYSTGAALENLGAFKGVSRMGAAGASTTFRFSMKTIRTSATSIPSGTKVSSDDNVYFSTDSYAEIPAGELFVDVHGTCTEKGEKTNNYGIGEIQKMVDVVPFIDSVSNLTAPQGGRDVERDEELRGRIFLAPESYTTAGSLAAYRYYVMKYDPSISDVSITSPNRNEVKIVSILSGGELPGAEYINGLKEFISKDNVKMLTDKITVEAPKQEKYDIELTYYINQSDRAFAEAIQGKVNEAVQTYVKWQKTKIGRDINPFELNYLVRMAGAKRAEIKMPYFQVVKDDSVGALGTSTVTYGGLEDD